MQWLNYFQCFLIVHLMYGEYVSLCQWPLWTWTWGLAEFVSGFVEVLLSVVFLILDCLTHFTRVFCIIMTGLSMMIWYIYHWLSLWCCVGFQTYFFLSRAIEQIHSTRSCALDKRKWLEGVWIFSSVHVQVLFWFHCIVIVSWVRGVLLPKQAQKQVS